MRPGPSSDPGRTALSTRALAGRDAELRTLDRAVRSVTGGRRSAVVAVVGEAGIGKTALLDELARRANAGGARVLRGRASAFEPGAALHLILGALGDGCSDGPPVALILDDLQWADDATVDLLSAWIDRPPEGRMLLALGHRPAERLARLGVAMGRASRERLAERLVLAPLDLAAAARLIGGRLELSRVAELHELCGGNPLYLEQLAEADGGPPGSIPGAVAASVASELEPFDAAALRLLAAGALLGDPFDAMVALEVAGLNPAGSGLDALETVARAGLVRPEPGGQPVDFRFRHPLIRWVVHEELGAVARRAGHARAAAALERRGASPASLAPHVAASAERGDPAAIALLTAAGKAVVGRAPTTAVRWLTAAWDLVPERERSAPAHLELATATMVTLTVTGDGHRALALLEAVLADLPHEHPARSAGVQAAAWVERMQGRTRAAARRLHAELATIPPGTEWLAIGVATDLAMSSALVDDLAGARLAVEEAARLAGLADVPLGATGVFAGRAWIETVEGDVPAAAAACDAALASWAPPPVGEGLTPALGDRALVMATLWSLDRRAASEEQAELGVIAARDGRAPLLAVGLIASRAVAAAERGALEEALIDARDATDEADLMAVPGARIRPAIAIATALEPTQVLDRAREAGERAVALALEADGGAFLVATAGQALAAVQLALALPGQALATLERTHGGDGLNGAPPLWRPRSLALASVAMSALGEFAGAARLAEAARTACLPHLPSRARYADHAAAVLALALGDGDGAARLAHRARQLAIGAGALLDAARWQLVEAQGLNAAGRLDDATAAWRDAERALAAMGADRLQREALRELRRVGRRVAPTRAAAVAACGPQDFTERQRQIALLVADGLTNRQIAERLVVTPKTVEYHLAAVFTKLGVRSRRELADRDATEALRQVR